MRVAILSQGVARMTTLEHFAQAVANGVACIVKLTRSLSGKRPLQALLTVLEQALPFTRREFRAAAKGRRCQEWSRHRASLRATRCASLLK